MLNASVRWQAIRLSENISKFMSCCINADRERYYIGMYIRINRISFSSRYRLTELTIAKKVSAPCYISRLHCEALKICFSIEVLAETATAFKSIGSRLVP